MSSAGVATGRCHITTFIGFWDLGEKVKYGKLLLLKSELVAEKSVISL
jgi:hypothetical protein